MDKQRLVSLIDDQPLQGGQVHVSEAAEEPTSETAEEPADIGATEESTDSNDVIMRQLANRFMEAEQRGPLSPQRAEAYRTLFEYFGRNK